MDWITRERPKIDRIACPWLIKRFIDKEARFYFVPFDSVLDKTNELNGIAYDIPDVEYTHYQDQCTFDFIIKKHGIDDPAVSTIANIVRAADTDQYELAGQASGLWAITAGLAHNFTDDMKLLEIGMVIYDALYSWAKFYQDQTHAQNPTEVFLIDIYRKYLKQKSKKQKVPEWVKELKEIVQDQEDTNLNLSLAQLSNSLQVHPTYLSREFSKYFEGQSFGDYMRNLRIDKAKELISSSSYSLSEIAYLTGFSDQSHFTRIFKKFVGELPSVFKRKRRG